MIKKLLRGLFGSIICVIFRITEKCVPNKLDVVFTDFCNAAQPKDYYLEYKLFPKKITSIPFYSYQKKGSLDKLAIILQGPISKEDNYTIETVKFYRQMYPEAKTIVSTWKDEDLKSIEELKKLGAIVVQSEDPAFPGLVNTNRQKVSTLAGIYEAQRLGMEYVAKTRTDQRLCRPHAFEFLINMLDLFPSNFNIQKKRIISLPTICAGDVFYPYTTGDYFFMGTICDMEMLWNFPDDLSTERIVADTKKNQAKVCNEGIMLRNYLEMINGELDYSIKNYWDLIKGGFICLDNGMVNLHYLKHDLNHYYSKSVNMMQNEFSFNDDKNKLKTECFGFVNWINLYYGQLSYEECVEKYAEASIF